MNLRNMAAGIAALKNDIKDLWNAFFDISDSNAFEQIERQGVARVVYWLVDSISVPLFIAMLVLLDSQGFSFGVIFLAAWAFDMTHAFAISAQEIFSKVDITIGKDFRRLFNELKGKNRWLAWVVLVPWLVYGFFWNGPAQTAAFFHLRQTSVKWWAVFLFFSSALQALFWMQVWMLGYAAVESYISPGSVALVILILYAIAVRRYFAKEVRVVTEG